MSGAKNVSLLISIRSSSYDESRQIDSVVSLMLWRPNDEFVTVWLLLYMGRNCNFLTRRINLVVKDFSYSSMGCLCSFTLLLILWHCASNSLGEWGAILCFAGMYTQQVILESFATKYEDEVDLCGQEWRQVKPSDVAFLGDGFHEAMNLTGLFSLICWWSTSVRTMDSWLWGVHRSCFIVYHGRSFAGCFLPTLLVGIGFWLHMIAVKNVQTMLGHLKSVAIIAVVAGDGTAWKLLVYSLCARGQSRFHFAW